MSINNVYVVKEWKGKWYGWDEMAEASILDRPNRELYFESANFTADTERELHKKMLDSNMIDAEYGFTTDYLPKDGTTIEYPETWEEDSGE